MQITDIKRYSNNAKIHTKEQYEKLAQSIKRWGWRFPIMVNKDGVIIAGHGRYDTWELNKEDLPMAWIVDSQNKTLFGKPAQEPFASEAEENLYRNIDNEVTLMTGFNIDVYLKDLELIKATGTDTSISSYSFEAVAVALPEPEKEVFDRSDALIDRKDYENKTPVQFTAYIDGEVKTMVKEAQDKYEEENGKQPSNLELLTELLIHYVNN